MRRGFTIGDVVHVYNRGNRKMLIVHDENDKWRLLKSFRYFNDRFSPPNLFRQLQLLRESGECAHFQWPSSWPAHAPIVRILAYCLMPNHFHLLLEEIIKGGISRFMKKLGDGFTNYINIKYEEVGSLFQGPYKAKAAQDERHLSYLDAYIQVFNPFELYPGGIERALQEFDKAFEFALQYPFCSLGESLGRRNMHIIDRKAVDATAVDVGHLQPFPSIEAYKEFLQDALLVRNIREILGKLTID